MSLKVYAWEKEKFPWHQRVNIRPEYRAKLTRALAKAFKIGQVYVRLDTRGGGEAFTSSGMIRLPAPKHRCSLGLIMHELAHHYDFMVYRGNGHRASFKKSLIKLFVEVRAMRMLPAVFAAIRLEMRQEAENYAQEAQIAQRRAQRAVEVAAARLAPSARLERVLERQKCLRTKIKRLNTALKKAERQARALERRVNPPVSESRPSDTLAQQLHRS